MNNQLTTHASYFWPQTFNNAFDTITKRKTTIPSTHSYQPVSYALTPNNTVQYSLFHFHSQSQQQLSSSHEHHFSLITNSYHPTKTLYLTDIHHFLQHPPLHHLTNIIKLYNHLLHTSPHHHIIPRYHTTPPHHTPTNSSISTCLFSILTTG